MGLVSNSNVAERRANSMTVSTSKNSIYRMLNYVTILFITERVNLSNQIQLRECASYSYCAHS